MSLKRYEKILFINYSFVNNLMNFFLDVSPPFLRSMLLKILLGSKGSNTLIDYGVYFRYYKKIRIGKNVEINRGCEFYPSFKFSKSFISIGDNTVIGPNVIFFGAGQNKSGNNLEHISESIFVGSNVYIGGNTIIRYGVKIGDRATIGAGTVVTKDVERGQKIVGPKNRKVT